MRFAPSTISSAIRSRGSESFRMRCSRRALPLHSLLSIYINAGLLDPLEVCRRVEAALSRRPRAAHSAEGYIRQIIGWREFVRGNLLAAHAGLCAREQASTHAPAAGCLLDGRDRDGVCAGSRAPNHRRGLRSSHPAVDGDRQLSLLIGVDPREVHEWYLMVYADAYEWSSCRTHSA